MSSRIQTPEQIVGHNLRFLREERNLTVKALAALLGWSVRKVSNLSTGRQRATPTDLFHLCRVLEITVPELLLPSVRVPEPPTLVAVDGPHLLDSITVMLYSETLFGSLATGITDEVRMRSTPVAMLRGVRDRIILRHPDVKNSLEFLEREIASQRALALQTAFVAAGVSNSEQFAGLVVTNADDGTEIDLPAMAEAAGANNVPVSIVETRAVYEFEHFARLTEQLVRTRRENIEVLEHRIATGKIPVAIPLPTVLPDSDSPEFDDVVARINALWRDSAECGRIADAWLAEIKARGD